MPTGGTRKIVQLPVALQEALAQTEESSMTEAVKDAVAYDGDALQGVCVILAI